MVAMSHTLNLEEGQNGIRSCVICPGEVATPIMVHRPIPETPETLARMIQPQDMGALIAFIARQPAARVHQRGADQPDAQSRVYRGDEGAGGADGRTSHIEPHAVPWMANYAGMTLPLKP